MQDSSERGEEAEEVIYPLIVNTLREFGLITDEQYVDAMCEYQQITDNVDDRMNAFRDDWLEQRAAKPWWRRWFTSKEEWIFTWNRRPLEERYPLPEDERQEKERLEKLLEERCA